MNTLQPMRAAATANGLAQSGRVFCIERHLGESSIDTAGLQETRMQYSCEPVDEDLKIFASGAKNCDVQLWIAKPFLSDTLFCTVGFARGPHVIAAVGHAPTEDSSPEVKDCFRWQNEDAIATLMEKTQKAVIAGATAQTKRRRMVLHSARV